jgi:hypothetical protein
MIHTSTTQPQGDFQMTKREIYKVRNQVHSAMAFANNSKATYSPLIRREWKKYGYTPVSALNAA